MSTDPVSTASPATGQPSDSAPVAAKKSGLGIASVVIGICAGLAALVPVIGCAGLPLAGIGFLLGLVGVFTAARGAKGLPAAGLGLNVAAVVVSLVVTSVAVQQATPEAQTARVAEAEPDLGPIEAFVLVSDYKMNEIAADTKYKGKVAIVEGRIKDIGKDLLDQPFITLEGGDVVRSVQCYFAGKDAEKLAELSKGSFVTVKGRIQGLMMNVQIKNCTFVTKQP
jgi:hypothetical protein